KAAGSIDRPRRARGAVGGAGNVECRQSLACAAPGPGEHFIGNKGGNAVCPAARRGPGPGESERGRGGEDGRLPARGPLLGDDEGARLGRWRHLARAALGVEAGARQRLARLVALVAARARLSLEPVVEEVRRRDEVLRRRACAGDIEERVGGELVL